MYVKTGLTISIFDYDEKLPIRAVRENVDRFCLEKGYRTGQKFTFDKSRFSNGFGKMMVNYTLVGGTYKWVAVFGYESVVTSIWQ